MVKYLNKLEPTLDTWSKLGISNAKTGITRGPAQLIQDVSAPEGKSDLNTVTSSIPSSELQTSVQGREVISLRE